MKKRIGTVLLVCLVICRIIAQNPAPVEGLQQIRANYIQALVGQDEEKKSYLELLALIPAEEEVSDQNIVELYQRFPVQAEEVVQLIDSLRPDGSWPDINYADRKRSGWEPKKHAERILQLTKCFYTGKFPESAKLKTAIHRAMNFWFKRDFSCLNWWYNQIGVPRTLGPAFLLFEPEMNAEEKELAIREMLYSKFGMTGQNKVWLAGNVLIRGLLQNDFQLVKAARDTIVSEIVLGNREGIKRDWSFHQHGPQQQWGNYGLSFLSNMCMYAEVFAHTPLALSDEQTDILFSFFKEGYRWIVWKGMWDVNALNRQLFHNADIHKSYTLLFSVYSLMQGCSPEKAEEIKQFIRENFTRPETENTWMGNKVFWESDQMIHRTPCWMASVKMASERVIGTELVNEDNKLGYYLGDGAMYVYVNGDEYHNVFPFWDWRKIPGITCVESQQPIPLRSGATSRNQSAFAGGVSDGQYGLAAMELRRDGLAANKCWIFTGRFVVCLGSGIQAGAWPVTTAVEQMVKTGGLMMLGKDSKWQEIEHVGLGVEAPLRFYHGNTGYVILSGDSCRAETTSRKGQWFDVMGMYTPRILEKEIMSVYIQHLPGKIAEYAYVVMPAASQQEVGKFDLTRLTILCNTPEVQAVSYNGTGYIAAYQPCAVRLSAKESLQIRTSGLYLIKKYRGKTVIYATDPTRKNKQLEVIFNHKPLNLKVNECGFAEYYL